MKADCAPSCADVIRGSNHGDAGLRSDERLWAGRGLKIARKFYYCRVDARQFTT
jgi:hypothetical protein